MYRQNCAVCILHYLISSSTRHYYGRTLSDASMLYFDDVFKKNFMAALVGQTAERIFTKLSHVVDIKCYLRTYFKNLFVQLNALVLVAQLKFNPSKTWNSSASWINFLTYSAGVTVYAVLCYFATAIKLAKLKILNDFIVHLHTIIQFLR